MPPSESLPTLLPVPEDADADAELSPTLATVARWVREFLAAPHEQLGRGGSVCPFVAPALTRASVLLAQESGEPALERAVHRMRAYRDDFRRRAAASGRERIFLAILVAFPDLPAERHVGFIEGIQASLKAEFMRDGLMIGEFHPGPPDRPGLWNADFRPFQAPVPLLAIRHMVAADVPFVKDRDEHLSLYLDRFADVVPRHLAPQLPTGPVSAP